LGDQSGRGGLRRSPKPSLVVFVLLVVVVLAVVVLVVTVIVGVAALRSSVPPVETRPAESVQECNGGHNTLDTVSPNSF
jgi:hypothetical protein